MLRLRAARVDLLTMPVPKPGIDPQRDLGLRTARRTREPWPPAFRPPASRLAILIDHVRRAAVHVDVVLDDHFERFAIEDIRGVHNLGRVFDLTRYETSG